MRKMRKKILSIITIAVMIFQVGIFVAAEDTILATYDFAGGKTDGWRFSGEPWKVIKSGSGNPVLEQAESKSGAASDAFVGDSSWSDYYIEADYVPIDVADGGNSVAIRAINAGNCYLVYMKGSSVDIIKKIDYKGTTLKSGSFNFTINKTYKIKLLVVGDVIEFYVDGKLILSANDDSLKNGIAGFTTWQSKAQFGNVVIGAVIPAVIKDEKPELKVFYDSEKTAFTAKDWQISGGSWRSVKNGIEQIVSASGSTSIALHNEVLGDFVFNMDYIPVSIKNGSNSLVLRGNESGNGYFLSMTEGSVEFFKSYNGEITKLAYANYGFLRNQVYNISVSVSGSHFEASVNGNKLISCDDEEPIESGKFGFKSSQASFRASNILASEAGSAAASNGIGLNATSLKMTIGQQYMLIPEVSAEAGQRAEFEWSSSASSIVKCRNGLLQAFDTGEAVITVKVKDTTLSATCTIKVSDKEFSDTENHWAKNEISYIASKGIVNGVSETEFSPDRNITRAEFLALAIRATEIDIYEYESGLSDVSASDWFAPIVQTGINEKIIDEALTAGNKFEPEKAITREEMTSIIVNSYNIIAKREALKADISAFTDISKISDWAVDYVSVAYELGIIKGINTTEFGPLLNAKRSEASVMIYRMIRQAKFKDEDIAKKMLALDSLVAELASKLDEFKTSASEKIPQDIFVTKGVADMFMIFIEQDLDLERYDLAFKEIKDTTEIVSIAIDRLNRGDYELNEAPTVRGAVPKEGVIYNKDNVPLFLRGSIWMEEHANLETDRGAKFLQSIGTNVIDWYTMPQKGYFPEENKEEAFENLEARALAIMQQAYDNNMLMNILVQQSTGMPDWFMKKYPEAIITGGGNHMWNIDTENPEVMKIMDMYFKAYTEGLVNFGKDKVQDTLFALDLANEPRFGEMSELTVINWRVDLEAKYGSIAALNNIWGTDYKAFSEIAYSKEFSDLINGNKAMLYDYTLYAQKRFNTYIQWCKDALEKYGDGLKINTHLKLEEQNVHWLENNYTLKSRLDLEGLSEIADMIGCDTDAMPTVDDPKYNLDWQQTSFFFDLYKSYEPDKVIFDSEWHAAEGRYKMNDIDREHIIQALRLGAYHGLSGAVLWTYTRTMESHWSFADTMPFAQPLVIDAFYSEAVRIENEMDRIQLFPKQERDIHILYSNTSHVLQGTSYFDAIRGVHAELNFKDAPIGFVSEKMLSDSSFINNNNLKMLVIPNTQYVTKSAFEGLKALAAKNVPIIIIGDALKYNELGGAVSERLSGKIKSYPTGSYDKVGEEMLQFAGLTREYTLKDTSGNHPLYVEARFADDSGKTIGYAINVGRETRKFKVYDKSGKVMKISEYKNGKLLEPITEIELPAKGVLSFDIVN